ncbi:MAG: MBL fold metallo-hydrolase [Panacagrimonas sp.]
MKILRLAPSGYALLGALFAHSVVASPAISAPVITAQRLSPKVWYFEGESGMATRDNRGFMSNAGFVVTTDGVVVFDALATPALAEAMIAAIRKVTMQPIRRVIVSHYHADHVYGLQVFKAADADIWARREGQQYLASDLARDRLAQRRQDLAPWVNEATHLVPADRWLTFADDQPIVFELGGTRFELIDGGDSHTSGDLMLSVPDQGVLFAGDLFFTGRLPFVVDGNTREWLSALHRLDRSGARIVVPGHGPASRDAAKDLAVTRQYLEFLRERMGHAVDELQTFEEAYAATDWSAFKNLPTFDLANRRNAYTVFLEMQAEMLGAGAADPVPATEHP